MEAPIGRPMHWLPCKRLMRLHHPLLHGSTAAGPACLPACRHDDGICCCARGGGVGWGDLGLGTFAACSCPPPPRSLHMPSLAGSTRLGACEGSWCFAQCVVVVLVLVVVRCVDSSHVPFSHNELHGSKGIIPLILHSSLAAPINYRAPGFGWAAPTAAPAAAAAGACGCCRAGRARAFWWSLGLSRSTE